VTCAEFFPKIVNGSRALGTISVQLSERKNGFLTPTRHPIKHLEFVVTWFGDQGVGGSTIAVPKLPRSKAFGAAECANRHLWFQADYRDGVS
jgi:hypothetical protein